MPHCYANRGALPEGVADAMVTNGNRKKVQSSSEPLSCNGYSPLAACGRYQMFSGRARVHPRFLASRNSQPEINAKPIHAPDDTNVARINHTNTEDAANMRSWIPV